MERISIYSFLQLGFEQSFACTVCLLILSVTMHVRIKFGDMVVTRTTTRPYKIAHLFFILTLLETIFIITVVNVVNKDDFGDFILKFETEAPLMITLMSFETTKFCLIFIFLSIQTHTDTILTTFVHFQKCFRLETLPIYKDRYNAMERKSEKVYSMW